jgi:hypothetical protein
MMEHLANSYEFELSNCYAEIESLRQRVAELSPFKAAYIEQIELHNKTLDELAVCEKELEFAKAEIAHLHLDIEEARRDTIRQVVKYLQMMHEVVKDKHNNYMVAANLINGEFNANNQHETSNQ